MEVVAPAPSASASGPREAGVRGWWATSALIAGTIGVVVAAVVVVASGDEGNVAWHGGAIVGVVASAMVARRRPRHPLVPWFGLLTAMVVWIYATQDLLRWQLERSTSAWVVAGLVASMQVATSLAVSAGVRVLVRFPDGVESDLQERWAVRVVDVIQVVRVAVVVFAAFVAVPDWLSGASIGNPLVASGFRREIVAVVVAIADGVVFVALAMVVRRYRRSDAVVRGSIRWLLLPLVAGVVSAAGQMVMGAGTGHTGALVGLVISSALIIAIACGIAAPARVDADTVVKGSLLWGVVWLAIAAAYVGISAAFGVGVGGRWSAGWAVTMTVIAMFALQPVRVGLERVASRLVFGPPTDPHRTIERLGESLARTYDLETLLPQIEIAIEEGLGVEWARVRLIPGGEVDERDPTLTVPIELDGEAVGVVECGGRRAGPLTDEDVVVVKTLARQAAMAVRNVRLASQLRARSDELAVSRSRLVRAEEAERRRIERDIHDGAQQHLVVLIGQVGLIRRRIARAGTTPGEVVDEMDRLQSGLDRLLSELRDLAAGIHPSVLRDRGLLAAVERMAAQHTVPVDVRADPELRQLRLPPEVEAAGYYTVTESLTNSLKHGRAGRVIIECEHRDDAVRITISDDGIGFEPSTHRSGNGLGNLTERVAAVDGRLAIEARPGDGTTVRVLLPTTTPVGGAGP